MPGVDDSVGRDQVDVDRHRLVDRYGELAHPRQVMVGVQQVAVGIELGLRVVEGRGSRPSARRW